MLSSDRLATTVAWSGIVVFGVGGIWALVAPESFFSSVAQFEPYNQHFIQDIGAFQIGLATVLILAVVDRASDALTVGLLGMGVGTLAHTLSHIIGRNLGGNPRTDIPLLAILGGLALAAGVLRRRG